MHVGIKGIYSHHDAADPVLKDPGNTKGFGDKSDGVISGGLAAGYEFDKRFARCLRVELEYAIRDMALLTSRREYHGQRCARGRCYRTSRPRLDG